MPEFLQNLKEKVRTLKKNAYVLFLALSDQRTPFSAKLFAGLTIAYLLSPIDLIPDFIPVLGLLDDLLIVPIMISISLKLIPKNILDELKNKISGDEKLAKKWYFALPIIIIYMLAVWCIAGIFIHKH